MSNVLFWYNSTRVDTEPIQFYPIFQFGNVLPNNNDNGTIVKFNIQGIATEVTIRNPRNEDLETLSVYEITSTFFWDKMSKFHYKNEEAL